MSHGSYHQNNGVFLRDNVSDTNTVLSMEGQAEFCTTSGKVIDYWVLYNLWEIWNNIIEQQ